MATEEKQVVKSINEDKRLFTAIVLRPNEVDAHGDIYDAETVEKACHDFTEFCRQGNLQHIVETQSITFVESHIAKTSYQLGEGEVKEGDWLMTARIEDDDLWKACKEGLFTGFSVGCKALVETLDE